QKEKSTVTTIDFVLFSLSEKLFHLSKGLKCCFSRLKTLLNQGFYCFHLENVVKNVVIRLAC
ncbi:hypothetical protein ACMZ6Y_04575, partial [Streptococcus pluranimalium]